jgi:hypothetical protein
MPDAEVRSRSCGRAQRRACRVVRSRSIGGAIPRFSFGMLVGPMPDARFHASGPVRERGVDGRPGPVDDEPLVHA